MEEKNDKNIVPLISAAASYKRNPDNNCRKSSQTSVFKTLRAFENCPYGDRHIITNTPNRHICVIDEHIIIIIIIIIIIRNVEYNYSRGHSARNSISLAGYYACDSTVLTASRRNSFFR